METTIKIKATKIEMLSLFNKGINNNADIRFYEFVEDALCKAIIRHSEKVILKEGATYTFKGFINKATSATK